MIAPRRTWERSRRWITAVACSAILFVATGSNGDPAGKQVLSITLSDALAAAEENDPRLRAATTEVERSEFLAELARVRGFLPSFSLSGYAGLIPGKTDDREEFDRIGPFHRVDIDAVWPIYTFGRAPALLRAAKSATEAEVARREAVADTVALDVIQAYEGLVAARAGEELAHELRRRYRELLETLESGLEDVTSGVDDGDLLEARTHGLTIERAAAVAAEQDALLGRLLARWLATSTDVELRLRPTGLPAWGVGPEVMEHLTEQARSRRPDSRAMAAATRALAERLTAARLASRPTVFLGGQVGHAQAPNRRDAIDSGQFNYTRVAALLGLRWDLTATRLRLEEAVADAEYRSLLERRNALSHAVEAEVAAAVAAVGRTHRLLAAARDSQLAAQRWLRLSSDNWEMGLGDLRRLIRAHEAYYSLRGEVIKAELEYRSALIGLAHALGDVTLYTRWCEHEALVLH